MLYREIIAVCSQIHTKHINTLCRQNVELLNVKLVVHIVTTGLYRVKQTDRKVKNCHTASINCNLKIKSPGTRCRVITDVSEVFIASFLRIKQIHDQ